MLRRGLSLVSVSALLAVLLGVFGSVSPAGALASGSFAAGNERYEYALYSVQTPAVRGKALHGHADNVSCGGGVNIPGGGMIATVGVEDGMRFLYWFYPPGTDSIVSVSVANATIDNAPPEGWGDTGKPRPVDACLLFHRNDNGTYRLKTMFTSHHSTDRDGRKSYDLALLDTGIELRLTQLP